MTYEYESTSIDDCRRDFGVIMSYCRTGPDSDVYAYRSTDRYSIHIAGNRYKQNAHCEIMYDCPEKPIFELASPSQEAWDKWWEENSAIWKEWERMHLNFDYHTLAGKAYHLKTLEEFKDKMIELKEEGLMIPDRVFERIEKEENKI